MSFVDDSRISKAAVNEEASKTEPKMQDNDQRVKGTGHAKNNDESRRLKYTEKILFRICFE